MFLKTQQVKVYPLSKRKKCIRLSNEEAILILKYEPRALIRENLKSGKTRLVSIQDLEQKEARKKMYSLINLERKAADCYPKVLPIYAKIHEQEYRKVIAGELTRIGKPVFPVDIKNKEVDRWYDPAFFIKVVFLSKEGDVIIVENDVQPRENDNVFRYQWIKHNRLQSLFDSMFLLERND